jgi:hypothetical protein
LTVKVQILPRAVITWKEFVETHPVRSIALDGYVKGKPRFNREGTHVNFNHHEDVNRLATRCTASQVSMAIKGGLLSVFTPENTTVWVNDCDWDVCLALWLLRNPTRIVGTRSEPLISRIVFNTDMMDTCAGAYPIDPHDRIMEEMAWVFAPYTDARNQGRVTHFNSAEMETIIDAVLDRISLYSVGQGQLQKPDVRYNVIGGGRDWKLVEEIGTDARTEMRAEGICAFVSYRGEENGRYIYSIGNLSPYRGFDLPLLYQKLNDVEALQGNDVWGGSDNCGGSARERGSSLCPQDLAKLIEEFQSNLANARFSDGSHPRTPLSTGQNKRLA